MEDNSDGSNDADGDSDAQKAREKTLPVTRRKALTLAGTALGVGAVGTAQASSHNAEVYENNSGDFVAENLDTGEIVYQGGDYINAIQAAVDSLTDGRSTKEKVLVTASGKTGSSGGSVKAVDLDSYTVVEQTGTMTVNDTGEELIVPYRGEGVSHIEIQAATIEGNPRYGIWLKSCTDIALGDINMSLYETSDVGLGIRVDDSYDGRSKNFSLDYAYVEGAAHHAVETYGLDGMNAGTVETYETGGCGLLLNDTTDATVQKVDATKADAGGGYAGFRCANGAGPNITVNEVRAVDCGRGIFTVSGSSGIEIYNVNLDGNGGNLIQDTRDTVIDGGTITNTDSSGVRIDSRSSSDHPHTKNVTVKNLDITGNGEYGVYETGPDTENNAILDNYFCNNASGDIETYSASTEVSGNTFC